MEVMFIELHGRNKNTSSIKYQVAVAYQPNTYKSDKLLQLENFEKLISEVVTKWSGVIITTRDVNADLIIGEQKESTKRYKNILHSFNPSSFTSI